MEDKYKPQDKYKKANIKQYALQLNKKTDSEIIELLDKQKNKLGFIKQLLKDYIDKQKNI